MASAAKLIANLYRDSVSLMQLSASLAARPGIEQASAIMATPANLALLAAAGLERGNRAPSPNDLLIAVRGGKRADLDAALAAAVAELEKPPAAAAGGGPASMPLRSLQMALEQSSENRPAPNLALISTPGEYAAAEALKALRLGLNAMLFSDNVELRDEMALKRFARDRGLLVMGPDCGTAIINGIPLGFANAVRRGAIGVVGASGTGTQQVTCLVHRRGAGISQAIGTGSHDLHAQVGGITMLQGIKELAKDPETRVIVLVSKPPSPKVAQLVLAAARRCGKPVVVNFVGAPPESIRGKNLRQAGTLEDAALAAVTLAGGRRPADRARTRAKPAAAGRMTARQRYVRGLFSGGTFCYEASALLGAALGEVWSNAPVDARMRLANVHKSRGHTLIDLGDDEFTRGRPHPMIDFRLRNERILAEARDPEVAVILLDVVLGYGAHADPAGELAPVLAKARALARKAGRNLAVVGFVCGTEKDPQGLARQEEVLRAAGMLLTESNAQAARLAASIAERRR
jgi:succinyl-CoA synthetase alpha subunit